MEISLILPFFLFSQRIRMGIPNMYSLVLDCFFLAAFILSFFICIPTGANVNNFDGHCLLYAKGDWTVSKDGSFISQIKWGSDSSCNFTIFIGVVALMLSLFFCVWTGYKLAQGLER